MGWSSVWRAVRQGPGASSAGRSLQRRLESVPQPQPVLQLRMKSLIRAAIIASLKVTPLSSHGDRAVVDRETTRRIERSRGVTILELAIVLFVVGVILGISIPLASSLAGRFKVGSARDVFVNSYARARATAVQYGRVARLHIDAVDREVWVEVDTGVV